MCFSCTSGVAAPSSSRATAEHPSRSIGGIVTKGAGAVGPLSMTTKSGGSFFDGIADFFQDLQKGMPSPAAKAAVAAKAAKEKEEAEFDGVWVMMNGLSGKMGLDVAAACLRKGFRIAPYSMSGRGTGELSVTDLEVST